MNRLQDAVAELVELMGEELAADLVADLVDGIKSGRRPVDEVARFMMTDAEARGDHEGADRARFLSIWSRPAKGGEDPGAAPARLSRVDLFLHLHRQAQDKEAVSKLAETQLSRTSLWRFKKEAGLL